MSSLDFVLSLLKIGVMKWFRVIFVGFLSLGSGFLGITPPRYGLEVPSLNADTAGEVTTPLINAAVFEQLIDHNNPSLGTFQQRYWYSTESWKGQGSPVSFPSRATGQYH